VDGSLTLTSSLQPLRESPIDSILPFNRRRWQPAVRRPPLIPTSACAGLSQRLPNEVLYLHRNAGFANHESTFLQFMSMLPNFAPNDADAIRKTIGFQVFLDGM
jgi:hypothetical protein